jgi:CRISPR/Cas system-associated protein Csm6
MKTTVEIPDSLIEEAKRLAARQDTTLRVLIIEGLRRVITERKRAGVFWLRKATFRGKGLQPDVAGASWERIREMAYEKRGG